MKGWLPDAIAYYSGPAADVYFQRAVKTLEGAGLDPVVVVDFFPDRAGILCGVNEARDLLCEALAGEDQLWALADGDAMAAKEVVMRVRAPYSHFGVYETALLGMLASCSGWASRAREVVDAAGGKRVISFGARHVHPLVGPVMEYAAIVGGCAGCAESGSTRRGNGVASPLSWSRRSGPGSTRPGTRASVSTSVEA